MRSRVDLEGILEVGWRNWRGYRMLTLHRSLNLPSILWTVFFSDSEAWWHSQRKRPLWRTHRIEVRGPGPAQVNQIFHQSMIDEFISGLSGRENVLTCSSVGHRKFLCRSNTHSTVSTTSRKSRERGAAQKGIDQRLQLSIIKRLKESLDYNPRKVCAWHKLNENASR